MFYRMNSPLDLSPDLKDSPSIDSVLNIIREFQNNEISRGRKVFGEYHHLFPILKFHPEKFKQYVRMNIGTFSYLLSKVENLLTKNWCNFHTQPIFPEEQLVVTLRFLATGSSHTHFSFSFRMGISTISNIVNKVVDAIWTILSPIHMATPTIQTFYSIAEQFYQKWNFPHCLGAIDGRHIRIRKPAHSGSLYYNYKNFHSIVLQAVVDANYKFITIDVGGYGSQGDGATFKASTVYKALYEEKLHFPVEDKIPNSHLILPYYLIGDGAYPLMENLMKPYPGQNLPPNHEQFNKRLSRARAVVENAFGFLCQKWRIFYTTINKSPELVTSIVKCACVLNNMIIDLDRIHPPVLRQINTIDLSEDNLINLEGSQNLFVVGLGKEVRYELTKHFMSCRTV